LLLEHWTTRDALLVLTQRYFTSHGPAQVPDFVWWSGLTAAGAKKGLALAGARQSALCEYDRAAGAHRGHLETHPV
jgi:Winged helix DNA-binding domain